MYVTLTPELEERIQEKVRQGHFSSAEAVIEQAVIFFLDYESEPMSAGEFAEVEAAVERGLEQAERGEGVPLSEFESRMRSKHGISR